MSHRHSRASAACVLGLVVLGGALPAQGAPDGVCALVSRQEAASALGAAVPAGVEKTVSVPLQGRSVQAQICRFGSEVSVARVDLGAGAPALFARHRQSLATQDGYLSANGLGDEAFFAKGQLTVRLGTTVLVIDVGQARGGGSAEQKAERALAVLALGRL